MTHQELADLADEYFDWKLRTEPISASMIGVHDYDSELGEFSREAEDRQITDLRNFVARAIAVDPIGLDAQDRITRDVLIFEAETAADVGETRMAELAVNHTIGLQALLPVVVPQLPIETAEHGDAFIERFRKSQQAFAEINARLEEGVAAGRTPMTSTARKTVEQIEVMLATPIAEDAFMNARVPEGVDVSEWRDRVADLIRDHVRPALLSFRDTIAEKVIPAGRTDEQPGVCHLPDGEVTYSRHVRQHTSLPLDPEEIHHLGLRQVDMLADEYRTLGQEVLGTSDLSEIFAALRDDPALHFESGAEVVAASETAMAKAKEAMGAWFGRLPKADCVVAETPTGPTAFYFPPATDGTRPGTFFVNTADPTRWGRFEIEAMAYHEGIPGHHLQLAIAQELENVPDFRKHAQVTVYAEGWGLYTERLADEMGLYSGSLERIGMLSADSMRAGRLVVDTGIHAKGWTRQQAIDYFLANSPMSQGTVEGEVDRYIGMPGQALSYMIGRLEINRMREGAAAAMGGRFDIKGFHDTVLGSGLVPMETLDRMVREWAAA
jgi:uncharacterized protein (DUF885 family)